MGKERSTSHLGDLLFYLLITVPGEIESYYSGRVVCPGESSPMRQPSNSPLGNDLEIPVAGFGKRLNLQGASPAFIFG